MKNIIICVLLTTVLSCSQRSNHLTWVAKNIFNRKEPVKLRQCAGAKLIICDDCYQPYILKAGDKIFESPLLDTVAGTAIHYYLIKGEWIQSFEFLEDEELRNKYGRPGERFGVELITLKKDALEKMPLDLRNKFITEQVESIHIEITERHDLSKPARKSLIEFQKNHNGSLLLSRYTVSGKSKRIGKIIEIDKQRLDTFIEWKNSNNRKFYINDFVSNKSLHYRKDSEIIEVDSLEFCQKCPKLGFPRKGDFLINVVVKNQIYSDIIFQNVNDYYELRDYLLVYKLLGGKVSARFPKAELFSETKFDEILDNRRR